MSHQNIHINNLVQRFVYGQLILDDIIVEFYIVGEYDINDSFSLSAYEIETHRMLTGQSEDWADLVMFFEFEKEDNKDVCEVTSGLLFEKEIGCTNLSFNEFLIYEWCLVIQNEIKMEFRAQYRYCCLP